MKPKKAIKIIDDTYAVEKAEFMRLTGVNKEGVYKWGKKYLLWIDVPIYAQQSRLIRVMDYSIECNETRLDFFADSGPKYFAKAVASIYLTLYTNCYAAIRKGSGITVFNLLDITAYPAKFVHKNILCKYSNYKRENIMPAIITHLAFVNIKIAKLVESILFKHNICNKLK